jgi:hypothetical protein
MLSVYWFGLKYSPSHISRTMWSIASLHCPACDVAKSRKRVYTEQKAEKLRRDWFVEIESKTFRIRILKFSFAFSPMEAYLLSCFLNFCALHAVV